MKFALLGHGYASMEGDYCNLIVNEAGTESEIQYGECTTIEDCNSMYTYSEALGTISGCPDVDLGPPEGYSDEIDITSSDSDTSSSSDSSDASRHMILFVVLVLSMFIAL